MQITVIDGQVTEIQTAEQVIVANAAKWVRTRRCGCGECRFLPTNINLECPRGNEATAIWLWSINPDLIGQKDYPEPEAFLPPRAFTEREVEAST